ncbi:MAG: N-acetyltransferase [Acidobacteria bacterium]|nr:N-acetyltransferase [Acidobacteriota bacterium]
MDINAYQERIKYNGSLCPTAETLRALQAAQLLTVPFENLSIHSGQPISLNDEALFDKIVKRRRGGFCYELNGLFAAFLRALGFQVTTLSAGVAHAGGGFGPEFDHMTLVVTLAERWLVDVGFGDSFREPLLLDYRGDQIQGERRYQVVSDDAQLILRQRDIDGEWTDQYRFSLQPHVYNDFVDRCRYQETSPESHFTQGRICTRATPSGRITLSQMKLITTTRSGGRQERVLANEEEFANLLREEFGIIEQLDFGR